MVLIMVILKGRMRANVIGNLTAFLILVMVVVMVMVVVIMMVMIVIIAIG